MSASDASSENTPRQEGASKSQNRGGSSRRRRPRRPRTDSQNAAAESRTQSRTQAPRNHGTSEQASKSTDRPARQSGDSSGEGSQERKSSGSRRRGRRGGAGRNRSQNPQQQGQATQGQGVAPSAGQEESKEQSRSQSRRRPRRGGTSSDDRQRARRTNAAGSDSQSGEQQQGQNRDKRRGNDRHGSSTEGERTSSRRGGRRSRQGTRSNQPNKRRNAIQPAQQEPIATLDERFFMHNGYTVWLAHSKIIPPLVDGICTRTYMISLWLDGLEIESVHFAGLEKLKSIQALSQDELEGREKFQASFTETAELPDIDEMQKLLPDQPETNFEDSSEREFPLEDEDIAAIVEEFGLRFDAKETIDPEVLEDWTPRVESEETHEEKD
jgi:hypothetical protein